MCSDKYYLPVRKVRDSAGHRSFCAGLFYDEMVAGSLGNQDPPNIWDVEIPLSQKSLQKLLNTDRYGLLAHRVRMEEKLSNTSIIVSFGWKRAEVLGSVIVIITEKAEYRLHKKLSKIYTRARDKK